MYPTFFACAYSRNISNIVIACACCVRCAERCVTVEKGIHIVCQASVSACQKEVVIPHIFAAHHLCQLPEMSYRVGTASPEYFQCFPCGPCGFCRGTAKVCASNRLQLPEISTHDNVDSTESSSHFFSCTESLLPLVGPSTAHDFAHDIFKCPE